MAEEEMAFQHRYCLPLLKHSCAGAREHSCGALLHPHTDPKLQTPAVTAAHLYLRHNGADHDQFSQVHRSGPLHYV